MLASNVVPFPARYPHSHDSAARELPAFPQPTEAPQYVPGGADTADDGDDLWARLSASEQRIMRRQVDADLAALGVCYRARIWRLFSLREVATALCEVQDCLRARQRIGNPAGLFVRVLEGNTGRSVFH